MGWLGERVWAGSGFFLSCSRETVIMIPKNPSPSSWDLSVQPEKPVASPGLFHQGSRFWVIWTPELISDFPSLEPLHPNPVVGGKGANQYLPPSVCQ